MNRQHSIDEHWCLFQMITHPELGPDDFVYTELRKTFYAGSMATLHALAEALDGPDIEANLVKLADTLKALGEEHIAFTAETLVKTCRKARGQSQ